MMGRVKLANGKDLSMSVANYPTYCKDLLSAVLLSRQNFCSNFLKIECDVVTFLL